MKNRNVVSIQRFLKGNRDKGPSYTFRLYQRITKGKAKTDWPWYLELYRGKAFSLGKGISEAEARDTRAEVMALVRDGKLVDLNKGEKITLGQLKDEYLEACRQMVEQGEIRQNTLHIDKYAMMKFVDIIGGDVPMRHVTRETVRRFKAEYLAEHGQNERAMRGCNTYMRHLSVAWDWAMREERVPNGSVVKASYVDMNPFISEKGRRGERMKFKVTERMPIPLMPHEISAIRAAMLREFRRFMRDANDPALTPSQRKLARNYMQGVVDTDRVFIFMLFSGLRVAEMVRFEHRDIQLSLNSLKVRSPETMGKGIKDYEERNIRLQPPLRELLNSMFPEGLPQIGPAVPLFPRWSSESSLSHRMKDFFRLADVDKPPKATRHSFASYRIAAGDDIVLIQREMGHSSITTTHKYVSALGSLKDNVFGREFVAMMEQVCRELSMAAGM